MQEDKSGPASGLLPMGLRKKNFFNIQDGLEEQIIFQLQDSLVSTIKYPMVSGKEWTDILGGPSYTSTTKYLNFENINIPAGTFSCMKSSLLFSFRPNDPMFHYYSKFGLLKRYWFENDLVFSTFSNPEGIGIIDFTDETIVTSFSIPAN